VIWEEECFKSKSAIISPGRRRCLPGSDRRRMLYIQKCNHKPSDMNRDLKARIYGILEPGDEDSRYFDPFIMGLIVLNVVAVVLETVDWLYARYSLLFYAFELFSVSVFTVEYILRVWSCTANPSFKDPIFGRLRFMTTPCQSSTSWRSFHFICQPSPLI